MAEPFIFKSPYGDSLPKRNYSCLSEFVFEKIPSFPPHKPALIEGDRVITYSQLPIFTFRTAQGLRDHGVKKNDMVCICSLNHILYPIILQGVGLLGATSTTVNPQYTKDEIRHQLQDSQSKFIITISAFLEKVNAAASEYGHIEKIFLLDSAEGYTSIQAFTEEYAIESFVGENIDPEEDIFALPYSSGTTGLPKGVCLSHANIASNILQVEIAEHDMSESDVLIGILPFFHIYAMTLMLNLSFRKGVTVVVMARFDLHHYLDTIQKHKVTYLHVVPPIVLALAHDPSVLKYDLSSVKVIFSGAAPLGESIQKAVSEKLKGIVTKQAYGMTESSPATHVTPTDRPKPGSIGLLLAGCSAKIIDPETFESVSFNRDGELWVKGPNVMKRYHNNPEATANTVDHEGYLHTGDIVRADEESFFYIVDRLKELIKYKGFQVAPAELEALLVTHPDVSDAAIIGIPDEEAGELPRAYVSLKKGHSADPNSIRSWLDEKVANYKRLRAGCYIISSIPRSGSGKILRRLLKTQALQGTI